MSASIVARSETSFTVQVEIPYSSSMLDFEEVIQDRLNQAGVVATEEALQQFDTDGSPITIGSVKFTSKGPLPKEYQTPYGVATVSRHVYQSSQGGKTYCPLDRDARIVTSSTPRFAKMVAHKYAEFGSGRVLIDLEANHGRKVARSFIQNVADAVAAVALAKEESWNYALPEMEHPVTTITLGLDGTCLWMCEDGWRETMVGTIGFYDKAGERQHTTYMAATPEYGKATFLDRMEQEIGRVKALYPQAHYVGIADGARGNWDFLGRHTEVQVIDFWHAVEYLGKAAAVLYRGHPETRQSWMDESCHTLEARRRGGRGGAEAVEISGEGAPVGESRRGRAEGDHLLREPVGGGPDGLPQPGGGERADRQRGDGGGVQGDRQAAAVRFGDEVEGAGSGGGVERAVPDVYDGALVAVLGQDRPLRIPRRCIKEWS